MFENTLITPDHLGESVMHKEKKKTTETNLIVRSLNDPTSRKKAIHAHCFMCIGGTEGSFPDPGWRKDIGECTGQDCCLKPFRPFQKKESPTKK